jgi:hypothetical protein
MKKMLPTLLVAIGLAAAIPALAQTGTGKSGGDVTAATAAEVEAAPPALNEEVVAGGSDADQAIENLASPVDPLGNPAGYVETLVTWWKAGYLIVFFVAIGYGGVLVLARYVPLFQSGKWALAATVGAAFLGDLIARLATGTPVTIPIVLAAAGYAWTTYINGNKASQIATKAVNAKTFGPAS